MKVTECTCVADICEHHPQGIARERVGSAIYWGIRSGILLLEDVDDEQSAELDRVLDGVVRASLDLTPEVRAGLQSLVDGPASSITILGIPDAIAWIRRTLAACPPATEGES